LTITRARCATSQRRRRNRRRVEIEEAKVTEKDICVSERNLEPSQPASFHGVFFQQEPSLLTRTILHAYARVLVQGIHVFVYTHTIVS